MADTTAPERTIEERVERLELATAALADASCLCGARPAITGSALLVEFVNEHRARNAVEYEARLVQHRAEVAAQRAAAGQGRAPL